MEPYESSSVRLTWIIDQLLIILCYATLLSITGKPWQSTETIYILVIIMSHTLSASYYRLYNTQQLVSPIYQIKTIWRSWLSIPMIICYLFLTTFVNEQQTILLLCWLSMPCLMTGLRLSYYVLSQLLKSSLVQPRSVAILGLSNAAYKLQEKINNKPWMGMRLIGIYDDRKTVREKICLSKQIKIRGSIETLIKKAKSGEIQVIYITLPMRSETRIKQFLDRLSNTTVSIYYVPDYSTFETLHASWFSFHDLPVLSLVASPSDGLNDLLKRISDIVLSSICLLILAIPMLIIAIMIKLTNKQSVIFKQKRHGLDGKTFEIYKFRTMTVSENGDDFKQAKKNDSRVTPLGAFLRRTSLDELPQIINVLQGRMSLVGPRPHPTKLNEEYQTVIKRYMLRHKMRPGITGWAQINGFRGETDTLDKMQKRIELDLEYINNWSIWLDIKILIKTFLIPFKHSNNAY